MWRRLTRHSEFGTSTGRIEQPASSEGWVDEKIAGTVDGDNQAVQRIMVFLQVRRGNSSKKFFCGMSAKIKIVLEAAPRGRHSSREPKHRRDSRAARCPYSAGHGALVLRWRRFVHNPVGPSLGLPGLHALKFSPKIS